MQDLIIEFGRRHEPRKFFDQGWANPEASHTWTLGAASALRLGPLAAGTTVLLKLDVFPHVQPGLAAQRLAVEVNGRAIAAFLVERPGVLTCLIPVGVLDADAANLIRFSHPDAARPADFAEARSSDTRALAIGFRAVHLQEIGGPMLANGRRKRRLVLLTGLDEAKFIRAKLDLAAYLVKDVQSLAALGAVLDGGVSETRLLAYCTSVIVPEAMLRRLPGRSYNIHPGPPDYPGANPCAWGAYDGCRRFGATLHEMTPRVDDGPIVDVAWTDIPPGATHAEFARRTRDAAMALLQRWLTPLAESDAPLPRLDQEWGQRKTTYRQLAAMRRITPDIDADELQRRRRAFADLPGENLVMTLHGCDFVGTTVSADPPKPD